MKRTSPKCKHLPSNPSQVFHKIFTTFTRRNVCRLFAVNESDETIWDNTHEVIEIASDDENDYENAACSKVEVSDIGSECNRRHLDNNDLLEETSTDLTFIVEKVLDRRILNGKV